MGLQVLAVIASWGGGDTNTKRQTLILVFADWGGKGEGGGSGVEQALDGLAGPSSSEGGSSGSW